MKKTKEPEKSEWRNKLYYGDNLDVLRKYIKDETIDLCYIDPPFNSKRNYFQIYLNKNGSEDKAQAQAFIDTWTWNEMANKEFNQIINNENGLYSGQTIKLIDGLEKVLSKGDLFAYLVSMTIRIAEIHRVLKKTGSFYLHCDPTASHYLKLVCDSIFCSKGGDFKREIIWSTTDTSGFKSRAKNWIRSHDTILYYTKSENYTFNKLFWDHNPDYIKRFKKTDAEGRRYRNDRPGGRIQYLEDTKGKIIGDVWDDIDSFQQASTNIEYLGYPTQKRKAILERILESSSNKNDMVLDAYCGCGTTIDAAQELGRKWMGIDITYQSISVILKRLDERYKNCINNIEINGVPKDYESAKALALNKDDRTRKEFEKWIILTYSDNRASINEQSGADKGMDGKAFITDYIDFKNKGTEYEQKLIIFSAKSNNKPQINQVRELVGTMTKEKAVMGFLLLLNNPTDKMIKECNSLGTYYNTLFGLEFPMVSIITVADIFDNKKLQIPKMIETPVLKKAKKKTKDKYEQIKLFSEAAEPETEYD